MATEISKENMIIAGNFISQTINDQSKLLERINSSEYTYGDIFDYECMDYFISGMIATINSLELNTIFTFKNSQTYLDIVSKNKEISFKDFKVTLELLYTSVRENQKKFLLNQDMQINYFDNYYLLYPKVLTFLYYFYGSKIICSFFGINVDGKINTVNQVTIDDDDTIIKDSLEEYRRYISDLSNNAKQAVILDTKIKTTNVRIEALSIRKSKVAVLSVLSDKSYKANNENEFKYLTHRINFFNTELIKFRAELRDIEDKMNESLKIYCEKYIGVSSNNE